jgi:hypothetical protein
MRPTFARLAREAEQAAAEAALTAEAVRRHEARREDPAYDAVDRWTALSAIASGLEKTYSGIERALTIVAAQIDGEVPRDPAWHRSLLDQMAAPLPEVRPAVLSPECATLLETLRAFRHRERHLYGGELLEDRLLPLIRTCTDATAAFAADVVAFRSAMERPA